MKKSRFKEHQIVNILKEQEAGMPVAEICRKHGISAPTFHNWKKKYGNLTVSELVEKKQLMEENARLKKIVANQCLDIEMLKDVNSKKW